jgi:hypothetical protein
LTLTIPTVIAAHLSQDSGGPLHDHSSCEKSVREKWDLIQEGCSGIPTSRDSADKAGNQLWTEKVRFQNHRDCGWKQFQAAHGLVVDGVVGGKQTRGHFWNRIPPRLRIFVGQALAPRIRVGFSEAMSRMNGPEAPELWAVMKGGYESFSVSCLTADQRILYERPRL